MPLARIISWRLTYEMLALDRKDLITKTCKTITRISSLALAVLGLALGGCATSGSSHTESMLSAAGFRTITPRTAQQRADYAALPPYEVQQRQFDGQLVYAYADEDARIVYVGNAGNYQRYQKLAQDQKVANQEFAASEENQDATMHRGFMGPAGESW